MEGEDGPRSRSHSRLFSGFIVISAVNIIGVLSDLVLIYTIIRTRNLSSSATSLALRTLPALAILLTLEVLLALTKVFALAILLALAHMISPPHGIINSFCSQVCGIEHM